MNMSSKQCCLLLTRAIMICLHGQKMRKVKQIQYKINLFLANLTLLLILPPSIQTGHKRWQKHPIQTGQRFVPLFLEGFLVFSWLYFSFSFLFLFLINGCIFLYVITLIRLVKHLQPTLKRGQSMDRAIMIQPHSTILPSFYMHVQKLLLFKYKNI